MLAIFKQRFWQPPRAHGDVIEDRSVGFIELFYDLVYVVVIARAAHHLAEHLTWRGAGEFAVIFSMVWLAWLNGSLYQDLHGREDGRSRTYIFLQMGILAVLGVYTSDAAGDTGQGFALTYTVFLVVITWLWYTVRRQDDEAYSSVTARYITGLGISIVLIAASAAMPAGARITVWAVYGAGWVLGSLALRRQMASQDIGPTESTVERFGLFTIIVLGEVVVGVVTGLSEATRDFRTVATGLLGLGIGFGAWWTYFDFVGRRHPAPGLGVPWMMSHLPVSMGIAGLGAALVGLVGHADDLAASAGAAWILTGSLAIVLGALVVTIRTLADFERLPTIYEPLTRVMLLAAGLVLVIGWWRPAPWLLVLALYGVLAWIWIVAVDRWLRLPDPSAAQPGGSDHG